MAGGPGETASDARPAGEIAWPARCRIGESPVWDAEGERLFFVDIAAGRLHVLEPRTGRRDTIGVPAPASCVALARSGRLLVAQKAHVAVLDLHTNDMARLTDDLGEPERCRLNDGKVGPDGCFWIGGMDETRPREPVASLYRVTPDGRAERKLDGLCAANGLAWSPDGGTMYVADTGPGTIDAWDFDRHAGAMANRRRVATLTDAEGRPDGGATDAEGCYWSAGVSSDCLHRFSPAGALLARVRLALPSPTMPCFAGPDLFVTTLWSGRPDDMRARLPEMGGLLRLPAPVAGSPVPAFADA